MCVSLWYNYVIRRDFVIFLSWNWRENKKNINPTDGKLNRKFEINILLNCLWVQLDLFRKIVCGCKEDLWFLFRVIYELNCIWDFIINIISIKINRNRKFLLKLNKGVVWKRYSVAFTYVFIIEITLSCYFPKFAFISTIICNFFYVYIFGIFFLLFIFKFDVIFFSA